MSDRELLLTHLQRVRKRIEKPENWCQKSVVLNSRGHPVSVVSDEACRWCIAGAIALECYGGEAECTSSLGTYLKVCQLVNNYTSYNMIGFNDSHEHADVLALLDKVITDLENQETIPCRDEANSSTP